MPEAYRLSERGQSQDSTIPETMQSLEPESAQALTPIPESPSERRQRVIQGFVSAGYEFAPNAYGQKFWKVGSEEFASVYKRGDYPERSKVVVISGPDEGTFTGSGFYGPNEPIPKEVARPDLQSKRRLELTTGTIRPASRLQEGSASVPFRMGATAPPPEFRTQVVTTAKPINMAGYRAPYSTRLSEGAVGMETIPSPKPYDYIPIYSPSLKPIESISSAERMPSYEEKILGTEPTIKKSELYSIKQREAVQSGKVAEAVYYQGRSLTAAAGEGARYGFALILNPKKYAEGLIYAVNNPRITYELIKRDIKQRPSRVIAEFAGTEAASLGLGGISRAGLEGARMGLIRTGKFVPPEQIFALETIPKKLPERVSPPYTPEKLFEDYQKAPGLARGKSPEETLAQFEKGTEKGGILTYHISGGPLSGKKVTIPAEEIAKQQALGDVGLFVSPVSGAQPLFSGITRKQEMVYTLNPFKVRFIERPTVTQIKVTAVERYPEELISQKGKEAFRETNIFLEKTAAKEGKAIITKRSEIGLGGIQGFPKKQQTVEREAILGIGTEFKDETFVKRITDRLTGKTEYTEIYGVPLVIRKKETTGISNIPNGEIKRYSIDELKAARKTYQESLGEPIIEYRQLSSPYSRFAIYSPRNIISSSSYQSNASSGKSAVSVSQIRPLPSSRVSASQYISSTSTNTFSGIATSAQPSSVVSTGKSYRTPSPTPSPKFKKPEVQAPKTPEIKPIPDFFREPTFDKSSRFGRPKYNYAPSLKAVLYKEPVQKGLNIKRLTGIEERGLLNLKKRGKKKGAREPSIFGFFEL